MKIWILHKRNKYDDSDVVYVFTDKKIALAKLNDAIDYDDDPDDPDPIETRARHLLVEFDVDVDKTQYTLYHINIDKDGNVVKTEKMLSDYAAFVVNDSGIVGLAGTVHFLIPNEDKDEAINQALHYYNELKNSEAHTVIEKWHHRVGI